MKWIKVYPRIKEWFENNDILMKPIHNEGRPVIVERFIKKLTLFRVVRGQKGPLSKICHTYPTMMKLGSYKLTKEDSKNT